MENEHQYNNESMESIDLKEARVIKNLDGHSSIVELIESGGNKYILKTADKEDVWNEKDFLKTLHDNGMPSLDVYESDQLKDNQLLLEYIPDSKGIEWEKPEEVERWGAAVRKMHSIPFDKPFKINSENQRITIDWNSHLKSVLDNAIKDQLVEQNGLSKSFLENIRNYVYEHLSDTTFNSTLIHGDLHDGNTLIKNGEVVLYDKSSEIFAGDPIYDLTIILTHFPNGSYIVTDEEKSANDKELLEAFMKGYGEDFLSTQKDKLDLYLVIRALDRYPNPFEIFNRQIIENIIGKQNNEVI